MATMLGSLLVSLGMESAQFKRGLKDAKSDVSAFSKFASVGLAAAAAGASAAAAAFAMMVRNSIDVADEISKAAQSIGIGTEELSRLRYAADLSGVSFEQLQTGVGRLSRNMLDASRGIGTGQRAFQRLGIEVTNADGTLRSATEVMGDVADRFSGMQDGAEKTALAMEIFGRAGATLIPMLNGGRTALAELTAEADKFGIVIDAETGRKAEAFNDNISRLEGQFNALAINIAADLLPQMYDLSEWLIRNQGEVINAVKNFADFVRGVVIMGRAVADGVAWMEERFGVLFRAVKMILNPMGVLVNLATRLGGGGGGSGGPLGQTATAMLDMSRQAVAMGRAMGGASVSTEGAAKSIARAGVAASVAKDEFQDLLEAIYPENITRRQREQLALIDKYAAKLSDPFGARQRALGVGGEAPVSRDVTNQGPLEEARKVATAGDIMGKTLEELQGKAKVETVRIADTFALMSQRITGSLQGLANSIRSGDFIGILGGVLDLFTTLGGSGAFGKSVQGFLNRVPGNANGTRSFAGGLSIVGERGPELVNLPRRSQVIPNHKLNGMGGGMIAQIVPSPYFDVVVDGRIIQSAPAVANAGAMQAQAMSARSARRTVRR